MFRSVSKASATAAVTALGCALVSSALFASSHREAPFITELPKVDGTDFYMFRSYEPGREGFVTLIANYMPLQDSYGGPNYFTMDPNALYEIHVDNNGDSQEDITFQFRFQNVYQNATVPTGPTGARLSVPVPLVNVGRGPNADPIGPEVSDNDGLNVIENYLVTVVRGDRRSNADPISNAAATNATPVEGVPTTVFRKPVDNIGENTIPDYETYANNHISDITIPGCSAQGARVFVGQRREGFVVNLGAIFDRVNLNPLGARDAGVNILDDKNITSLALEVPISCLTAGGTDADPVIGAWTTASLRQARVLNPLPANPSQQDGELNAPAVEGGAWTQVSRLGSPLVNEVVIGLNRKDRFNASEPFRDLNPSIGFGAFVTNPTLPELINILFPDATTVPATPRNDLVAAFVTGVNGLNQPQAITAANIDDNEDGTIQPGELRTGGEMLRLNTAIEPTAAAAQSDLGFLGCDLAGFPNGRRPVDDVVDIALTVVEGAITADNPNQLQTCDVSATPPTVVNSGAVVTDGALPSAADYRNSFPYLETPLPGATTAP